MDFKTDRIYHGAAYYPELWPSEDVDKDIAVMKKLGINVVRMGEFSWCFLEPEKDRFQIGLFDEAIDKLGKNGILTVMGTPTATPPRWFTAEHPDSLYVDKNMMKANHGSREHVCFHSPEYIERTKIIVEKMAKHYADNPYIIAWQLHNEYNCPPVGECVCENCQREWRSWLKAKYGDIETMNKKWGTGVWSTRYNSFDDVIPPRPTPNGHSASMTTNYTRFTFDSVARYNRMQAEILKKYVKVPLTHNTNRVFHIDQESIFRPLDFVSFDDYSVQSNYFEAVFAAELCRCLKKGQPFWEMETAASYSANLHGRAPYHKKGYVKAQAVAGFFAGSVGFSYWIFRQQRSGTEMPHAHLVTSWGALSASSENVLDVSREIKKLEPFLLSTRPRKAEVALLYSDEARAFCAGETLSSVRYADDIYEFYKSLVKTSVYRDVVYEGGNFGGYKTIFVPYAMHIGEDLQQKLVKAAEAGATVVFGPYSGWRTDDHTYFTDAAFGSLEKYFGQRVEDVSQFFGQDASYEAFGLREPLEYIGAVVKNGLGTIRGGYYDGKSLIAENKYGKGKIVLLGAKLSPRMTDAFVEHILSEQTRKKTDTEEGIVVYERTDGKNNYLCLVNMSEEPKTAVPRGEYVDYFTGGSAGGVKLGACEYAVWKEKDL